MFVPKERVSLEDKEESIYAYRASGRYFNYRPVAEYSPAILAKGQEAGQNYSLPDQSEAMGLYVPALRGGQ